MNYLRQFCWTAKTSTSAGKSQNSGNELLATLSAEIETENRLGEEMPPEMLKEAWYLG